MSIMRAERGSFLHRLVFIWARATLRVGEPKRESCATGRRRNVATLLLRLDCRKELMKFCLEVGELEKNRVEFDFDQLFGQLVIKVNHQEVKRAVRLFNEPVKETHTLQLGHEERTLVRIEKQRKQLFGQKCCVFVNERLYKCYDGM